VLRTASGGEAGEPGSQDLSAEEARRRRARRLAASCGTLGVASWGWIDEGRWIDTGSRRARASLTLVDPGDLADALMPHMRDVRPDMVLTVASDGLTGHPDHILIHHAAVSAAHACRTPVFGSYLLPDDIARGHALPADVLPGIAVGSGRMTGFTPAERASFEAPLRAARSSSPPSAAAWTSSTPRTPWRPSPASLPHHATRARSAATSTGRWPTTEDSSASSTPPHWSASATTPTRGSSTTANASRERSASRPCSPSPADASMSCGA
jgi:LmbE family N-acetylglucosaminyl deacetylase